MARFIRIQPKTGDRFEAVRDAGGYFVMGDPRFGRTKHHARNAVRVRTEREVVRLLAHGFSLRMSGPRWKAPSLISPKFICVEGTPAN